MYTLNPNASIRDFFRIGTLNISPAKLKAVFGQPRPGNGITVSGSYILEKESSIFWIYEYKLTSLYEKDSLSPEDFWNSFFPEPFSIGSNKSDPEIFCWLNERLGGNYAQSDF